MGGEYLPYFKPERDVWSEWALRLSCAMSGAVAFTVSNIVMFLAATHWHLPNLLSFYPLAFAAAVLATAADGKWTRCVGVGAVAGSVVMSTVGYTLCLFIMSGP
jgi:hypothetical protein